MALVLVLLGLLALCTARDVGSEYSNHIDFSAPPNASVLQNSQFSISCISCTMVGDLSVSGGCNDDSTECVLPETQPDANFSSLQFDYSKNWVGLVVEDFKVHIELEITLTPSGPTNEITIPLLGADGIPLPLRLGGPLIDWRFNPIIHGWVNSSKPASFSYGFEFEIPKNSAIFIPALNPKNTNTSGFAQSSITPLNYTSKDPDDAFGFELSFRPIFKVTAGIAPIDLDAEVFADVPKLDITVAQVSNATRDCVSPAPPGTPSNQIFHNLTHVIPTLSFDVGFNATGIDDHELQLGDNTTLPTSCLDYLPSASALGPVPASANAATSAHSIRGGPSFALLLFFGVFSLM